MVRHILATGILPEGSLQLLCGSAGDLIDHVTGQDVVTFTGSAATGQMLRRNPAIVQNSVHFSMEADSSMLQFWGPMSALKIPNLTSSSRKLPGK